VTGTYLQGNNIKSVRKDELDVSQHTVMKKFSPYRTLNTLRLGYTNQSVNAV